MSAIAIEIPRWELHSELALVSPEVRSRALELLPERNLDLLTTPRRPLLAEASTPVEPEQPVALPAALLTYTLSRLAQTLRSCVFVLAGVMTLAALAQLLH